MYIRDGIAHSGSSQVVSASSFDHGTAVSASSSGCVSTDMRQRMQCSVLLNISSIRSSSLSAADRSARTAGGALVFGSISNGVHTYYLIYVYISMYIRSHLSQVPRVGCESYHSAFLMPCN